MTDEKMLAKWWAEKQRAVARQAARNGKETLSERLNKRAEEMVRKARLSEDDAYVAWAYAYADRAMYLSEKRHRRRLKACDKAYWQSLVRLRERLESWSEKP